MNQIKDAVDFARLISATMMLAIPFSLLLSVSIGILDAFLGLKLAVNIFGAGFSLGVATIIFDFINSFLEDKDTTPAEDA